LHWGGGSYEHAAAKLAVQVLERNSGQEAQPIPRRCTVVNDDHVGCPRCGHCCPDDTALLRQALEAMLNVLAGGDFDNPYADLKAAASAIKERLNDG
jgi:hypothetical protein